GLHLGEAMKPRLLDVVGYLLLSARDLEEALRSFVRFQHILSGGFAARLEVEGETARLILDINYLGYASLRQQIECLMLLFLKLLALISDDEFVAERIEFRHRAPPRLGEHRRLFGRLPLFSRPHDALVFSAALLRRPSRNANPDMHGVLTRHAEEQSRELSENRLLNRVRYLIELRLGEGYGLRQCAAELGLGSGALQRALAAG
ncbi:AraC family transcriptional regulator ligand-binding domain-containing protein, partial [Pseudomonas aeruginosa]